MVILSIPRPLLPFDLHKVLHVRSLGLVKFVCIPLGRGSVGVPLFVCCIGASQDLVVALFCLGSQNMRFLLWQTPSDPRRVCLWVCLRVWSLCLHCMVTVGRTNITQQDQRQPNLFGQKGTQDKPGVSLQRKEEQQSYVHI